MDSSSLLYDKLAHTMNLSEYGHYKRSKASSNTSKKLFRDNINIVTEHMKLTPNTLIRLHIFLEDTYSDPLLRDDQLLLDFFKFEQRLEIRTRHMEWRIRAEKAEKRSFLPH